MGCELEARKLLSVAIMKPMEARKCQSPNEQMYEVLLIPKITKNILDCDDNPVGSQLNDCITTILTLPSENNKLCRNNIYSTSSWDGEA